MARTIDEIKKQMTTEWLSQQEVRIKYEIAPSVQNDAFDSIFSKASIENIFFYVVAFAIHILERTFHTEKENLTQYAESLRPHTKQWYINTLKAFQLGHLFNEETGKYDIVDDQAQIIKYCSLRDDGGELYFLVAADFGGEPQKINEGVSMTAIRNYAGRVFDAGAHFNIVSKDPDLYRCEILINYDPLVLDGSGRRLDGTNDTPVITAINDYFRSFPFDSEFSNMALTDAIQQVEGVRIVQIISSEAKPNTALSPYRKIESVYTADSGYMVCEQANVIYQI